MGGWLFGFVELKQYDFTWEKNNLGFTELLEKQFFAIATSSTRPGFSGAAEVKNAGAVDVKEERESHRDTVPGCDSRNTKWY